MAWTTPSCRCLRVDYTQLTGMRSLFDLLAPNSLCAFKIEPKLVFIVQHCSFPQLCPDRNNKLSLFCLIRCLHSLSFSIWGLIVHKTFADVSEEHSSPFCIEFVLADWFLGLSTWKWLQCVAVKFDNHQSTKRSSQTVILFCPLLIIGIDLPNEFNCIYRKMMC
jgi:hypothetical protein